MNENDRDPHNLWGLKIPDKRGGTQPGSFGRINTDTPWPESLSSIHQAYTRHRPNNDVSKNPLITPKSPLDMQALYLELLRERFGQMGAEAPYWKWDKNIKKTGIVISLTYNKDKDVRNNRPALIIQRGVQTFSKVVLDNKAEESMKTGAQAFCMKTRMPIIISVHASKHTEAEILGDMVSAFVVMTSTLVESDFYIADIGDVSFTPPAEQTTDKNTWISNINFNLEWDVRWLTHEFYPILNSVKLKMNNLNGDSLYDKVLISDYTKET